MATGGLFTTTVLVANSDQVLAAQAENHHLMVNAGGFSTNLAASAAAESPAQCPPAKRGGSDSAQHYRGNAGALGM